MTRKFVKRSVFFLGLSFTTTDLSLVEMTEVEYTQLQHILHSHVEAAGGELEARLSPSPAAQQSSSNSGSTLEAAKPQAVGLPTAFSFCYQQAIESTKQTLSSRNKALPEQVWIKVGEEALRKQAINKRNRSGNRQLDTSAKRRALGEIQNVGKGSTAAQGVWQSSDPRRQPWGSRPRAGPREEGLSIGRGITRWCGDRRRGIRICCDELHLLVPFCNAETGKATNLQWTTAFLKYIQERYGDSLKKEFESVFCRKTGRRLKLTRPDSLVACPAQGSLQSSPAMVIK
ncbi:Transcription factor-like 5 protein [Sciurus carolinensis]|uniref:Transcription factor-like 5 protein n=1 Tax=Sciurus carolinensis TaxID=30640 RepID=A0AA41NJK8_SCICA|nr:Transcription factor-like 5 protein [Sciurus carolinensis]